MLNFNVSILPLITVAVVNFIFSWLFYSPIVPWFKTWQNGVGMDPAKTKMTEEDLKDMPRLMGGAVVATFLFSYGLQVLVHSLSATDFISGARIGFVAWLTFSVTHSLNTQFEGRKPVVLIINNCLYLLVYSLFAGIFAIWR